MHLKPVIDQTIHSVPLDALSTLAFATVLVAVFIVTMRRPAIGAAFLVGIQPFAFYHDIAHTTITFPKIALIAVTLAMLGRGQWATRLLGNRCALAIVGAIGIVASTTALSILHAHYRGPAIRETLKWLEYTLVFITIYSAYRVDPDERVVTIAITTATGVVAVIALSQEIFGAPSGMYFNGQPIPRIAGPLEGPNQLAGFLDVGLPLLIALSLTRKLLPVLIAIACCAAAEILTFSRAGLISAAIGLAFIFFVLRKSAWMKSTLLPLALGSLAGGAVAAFWGSVAHSVALFRISTQEVTYAGGVGTRSLLWRVAALLWRAHPIFGIGAGNFELEIRDVGPSNIRTHTNSLYLQSLVEQGMPGLLATLYLILAPIAAFWRVAKENPLILGALAGSIALALHQIVDYLVFYPKVGGWWVAILGLAAAAAVSTFSSTNREVHPSTE